MLLRNPPVAPPDLLQFFLMPGSLIQVQDNSGNRHRLFLACSLSPLLIALLPSFARFSLGCSFLLPWFLLPLFLLSLISIFISVSIFFFFVSTSLTDTEMSTIDTRSASEMHSFVHLLAITGSFDHMPGSTSHRLPSSGLLETWTHKH